MFSVKKDNIPTNVYTFLQIGHDGILVVQNQNKKNEEIICNLDFQKKKKDSKDK